MGPAPHTVTGFLETTATGAGEGLVLGVAGSGSGHAIGAKLMGTITHNPGADTVVMGRIMSSRVTPYAEAIDGAYYTGTPTSIHNALERFPAAQNKVDLWVNKKWINYQMIEGKNLYDVGGPSTLPLSGFYDMEHAQVSGWHGGAGYSHYSLAPSDLQNSFDLTGGIPH